jgi:hypothetical protein
VKISRDRLAPGRFLDPPGAGTPLLPTAAPGAASDRAGSGSSALPHWPAGLAAVAAALAIAAALAGRRRTGAAGLAAAAVLGALALAGVGGVGDGERAFAAEAPPPGFFGLVSEDVMAGSTAYRDRTLRAQVAAGSTLIRQTFDWAAIERRRGRYSFRTYDGFVGDLARHGVTVLPVLFHPPSFYSSRPRHHAKRGTYPPRHAADMGRFAAALVRRYGPEGAFWAQHPGIPRFPIRAWQIWNEPSLPVYWPSGPSPRQYTRLLKAVSHAIRAADPGAEVVTAGIPESRLGIPFAKFVQGMYRAGARGTFDTLAIHPYAVDDRGTIAAVAAARRLMDRNLDVDAGIRVTELGWASAGPRSRFTAGLHGQADRIAGALRGLAEARGRLKLRGVVYFNWRDARPYRGGHDFWGLHTGLLTISGHRKPALAAFRAAVAASAS